jgi:hypothetical protein
MALQNVGNLPLHYIDNANNQLGTAFFKHKENRPAAKKEDIVTATEYHT